MKTLAVTAILGLAATLAVSTSLAERVEQRPDGTVKINPLPTDERFLNTWLPNLEEDFQKRAQQAINAHKGKGYGGTYFENEKSSYPKAMMDFLGGNRGKAIGFLEANDTEAYNKYTNMVDFYPCFTLKGQMRKYYFFNDYLTPDYKTKFLEGAKEWTREDPRTRKHPLVERTTPGQGWMPNATGVCVDTRNTDNLQAMRDVAVYLMAEETGNKETMEIYKKKLVDTITNMYNVGMGEWDSNNYLGHTMTGFIQLYDFAKDPQMKLLGKAAMDYMTVTGALKYYRGGYGGPCKRDYNHPVVHSGSTADHLALYYGDYEGDYGHAASADNVHFITSAYRPPLAAVELARKQVKKPVELFVSHPNYNGLRGGADKPEYYETNFIGNTYTFGTLSIGTDGPGADTNGFKLLAYNTKRGADFFIANSTAEPTLIGSAQYSRAPGIIGGNNVGQNKNLAIWLNSTPDSPFMFYLPKSAKVEEKNGITFIGMEKTYIALRGVNLKINGIDPEMTDKVNFKTKVDKKNNKETKDPIWPDDQIISAKGTGGKVTGFVVEVGEAPQFKDFDAFKNAVASKSKLDLSALDDGTVAYTGADGKSLKVAYNRGQPKVWRDGTEHDWAKHLGRYIPTDGSQAPLFSEWKSGTLRCESENHIFTGTIKDGHYTFTNKKK